MDNLFYNICYKFLKINNICVNSKDFKKQLYSHEAYPSLKSLTDVLASLEIEYRALKIDWKQLQEYGTPVLLHYQRNIPRFIVAVQVSDKEIVYYENHQNMKTESLTDFSKYWSGAALYVIEPERQTLTCQLTEVFVKWSIRVILLLTIMMLISVFSMFFADKWFYIFLFLKFIGLFFSILLLRHDWGKQGAAEQHFCSLSKSTSCDAVLNSEVSKLFGILKMSDIGMIYFLGGFISLIIALILGVTKPIIDILGLLSICSFPYIIFSLSYQKFKVKKWCPLCLCVLSVLLIEICIGLIRLCATEFIFPTLVFFFFGVFFVWLALVWWQLSGHIKASFKADETNIRFLALKRNSSVFRAVLNRQPALDMAFSEHEIILGRPDIPLIITIAISPYCNPCLNLYVHLVTLLQKHPDVFRLNIRFMSMNEEDKNTEIGLALISIYLSDKEQFVKAFEFWKNEKNYSSFVTRYEVRDVSDLAKHIQRNHFIWRNKLNIKSTPTIFVNNKRFPEIYTENELLYFLQYKD